MLPGRSARRGPEPKWGSYENQPNPTRVDRLRVSLGVRDLDRLGECLQPLGTVGTVRVHRAMPREVMHEGFRFGDQLVSFRSLNGAVYARRAFRPHTARKPLVLFHHRGVLHSLIVLDTPSDSRSAVESGSYPLGPHRIAESISWFVHLRCAMEGLPFAGTVPRPNRRTGWDASNASFTPVAFVRTESLIIFASDGCCV